MVCPRGLGGEHFLLARPDEPAADGELHRREGRDLRPHARAGCEPGRKGARELDFPGWIDTSFTEYEGPDAYQQPAGRVGNPMDIANMVLYLCSDKAGFITGENICIDGGMTRQMITTTISDGPWTIPTCGEHTCGEQVAHRVLFCGAARRARAACAGHS